MEVVRLLLEAGADPNAAAEGSGCAVERPAKKKEEPSPPYPFEVPDGWVLTPIEPMEVDDWYEEETPLHAACAGCVCVGVGVDSAVDPSVLVHARASWGPGDEGRDRPVAQPMGARKANMLHLPGTFGTTHQRHAGMPCKASASVQALHLHLR